MTDTLTPKKTRTPRTYDSIEKGALDLEFAEQVKLRDALSRSISDKLQALKDAATQAEQLLTNTK